MRAPGRSRRGKATAQGEDDTSGSRPAAIVRTGRDGAVAVAGAALAAGIVVVALGRPRPCS